jgi:hypothetical protein
VTLKVDNGNSEIIAAVFTPPKQAEQTTYSTRSVQDDKPSFTSHIKYLRKNAELMIKLCRFTYEFGPLFLVFIIPALMYYGYISDRNDEIQLEARSKQLSQEISEDPLYGSSYLHIVQRFPEQSRKRLREIAEMERPHWSVFFYFGWTRETGSGNRETRATAVQAMRDLIPVLSRLGLCRQLSNRLHDKSHARAIQELSATPEFRHYLYAYVQYKWSPRQQGHSELNWQTVDRSVERMLFQSGYDAGEISKIYDEDDYGRSLWYDCGKMYNFASQLTVALSIDPEIVKSSMGFMTIDPLSLLYQYENGFFGR